MKPPASDVGPNVGYPRAAGIHIRLKCGFWARVLAVLLLSLCPTVRGDTPLPITQPNHPLLTPLPAPRWSVQPFAESLDLEHRFVFSIAFETNNSVWFGTSDGLFRYDGYYSPRFFGTNDLPSDLVRCVTVTRSGVIWLGTDKGAGTFSVVTNFDLSLSGKFTLLASPPDLPGPSVRRIVEGPDGALWFGCDPVPDVTQPSGVARLRRGHWDRWDTHDGLSTDHILSILITRSNEAFACTFWGVARLNQNVWETLYDPVNRSEPAPMWNLVESTNGTVLGLQADQTNVWSTLHERASLTQIRLRDNDSSPSYPTNGKLLLCQSPEGRIYGLIQRYDQLVIAEWTGEEFRQLSPGICPHWIWPEDFQMAPDGSFWMVGPRIVTRWVPGGDTWHLHATNLVPRLVDGRGRIWLTPPNGGLGATILDSNHIEFLPQMGPYLRSDETGEVWSWGTADHTIRHSSHPNEPVDPKITGIDVIHDVIIDAKRTTWFGGPGFDGKYRIVRNDLTGWHSYDLSKLTAFDLKHVTADPQGGLWGLAKRADAAEVLLAHIDATGVVPLYVVTNLWAEAPFLAADLSNRLWIPGNSQIYFWDTDSPLPKLDDRFRGWVSLFLPHPTDVGLAFDGRSGGGVGYGFISKTSWKHFPADLAENIGPELSPAQRQAKGRPLHLVFREGIARIYPDQVDNPEWITSPPESSVFAVVAGSGNNLWLASREGTMSFTPGSRPPKTLFLSASSKTRRDGVFLLQAHTVEWMTPWDTRRRERFSWQFDDGKWTSPSEIPGDGIPISDLNSGKHSIRVRSVNEVGMFEEVPLEIPFAVIGIPIQEQRWFAPLTAVLILSMSLLTAAARKARRELWDQKLSLEEIVTARTRQFRQKAAEAEKLALNAERLAAKAAVASRTRTEFLSTVSHELLTPMNGLIGFSDLLKSTSLTDEQRVYVNLLSNSGQKMIGVVRHILEFNEMGRDPLALELTSFDLRLLCEKVLAEVGEAAIGKGLAIGLDYPVDIPNEWMSDASRVRQVLIHLLENAIKFTKRGAVRLQVRPVGPKLLQLTVEDTGIGIPRERQSNLFEAFSQADPSTTREHSGLGLGLVKCQHLVMFLGGSIGFESTVGVGSRFWFTIPYR